jgi:hypothetical protein
MQGRSDFSYWRQRIDANKCTVNNYPHHISQAMNALTNGCIPHHDGQLLQSCCETVRDKQQTTQQNRKETWKFWCFVTRNCPIANLNRLRRTTKQRRRDSNQILPTYKYNAISLIKLVLGHATTCNFVDVSTFWRNRTPSTS